MGLFRNTLKDFIKKVDSNRLDDANVILDQHINNEHTGEGDLVGLTVAIHTYQQHLFTAKERLTKLRSGGKKTTKEQVKESILAAQAELTKVVALISKLRNEAKIKLT